MYKAIFLGAALTAICAFQLSAIEGRAGGGASVSAGGAGVSVGAGARYNSGGRTWAEGTVSSRGADGRISIRGTSSPYANDYFAYHHDYYARPDARVELGTRYRDRFNYRWSDDNLQDYTFTVPDYDNTIVYEEPNYGTDYTTWSYDGTPRAYRYNDLNVGDRVVIGYDENGNRVNSVYRLPARSGKAIKVPDNTRPNNTGRIDNTVPNNNAGQSNPVQSDNTRPGNLDRPDNTRPATPANR